MGCDMCGRGKQLVDAIVEVTETGLTIPGNLPFDDFQAVIEEELALAGK